jgi:hypothetical protein
MIYALPVTALGIAAVVGFVLGRARRGGAILTCLGGLALLLAVAVWAPMPDDHAGAVALVAVGALVALPGIAGVLGGALLGWLVQRHAKTA